MKKELLFVIDSLDCAGAEKSLVTLLSLIDHTKYNVDLMLFGHGGALQKLVPSYVNILEPLHYTEFTNMPLKSAVWYSAKKFQYDMLSSRLRYTVEIRRKKYSNAQKARVYWQSASQVIEENPKAYDIAISYAQGIPTFYVAEKVKAAKKFAWVNVSYRLNEEDQEFQKEFYQQYDRIVAVSESTKEILLETFPIFAHKIDVIYDINNPYLITEMANLDKNIYQDGFKGIRILTIGRFAHQKGYDIAIEACKKLKEKGVNFRWYALGKGPLESEIKELILQKGLTEEFKLLGVKSNPYPFIKNADIYVQTSRFEGFGLAIAEARMLNVPVVTTKFDAVFNQMIDQKNGLVVDMNPVAVYEGILRIITNNELKENIVQYLKTEKKGNTEELEKFYQLIG
ncbi:glycosyltransferase [Mesobacillus subterraneus]|uniref:glycosyltransferase n=1 Tax=Mesobacillus subterraneus TaxID=285983 RepID=UPI00204000DF|nr:glycosyltransferase [Mesobacillus subterraneus]MCM3665240.1 glycosyltransferase [Mesobacillus subterraneus]MCM3684253.1 glycosyltransferase [Mesobacillus subterraneus]